MKLGCEAILVVSPALGAGWGVYDTRALGGAIGELERGVRGRAAIMANRRQY
jgi:hypothetical protein